MTEAGTDATQALVVRLQPFVDFWRERGQFSGEISAFEAAIEAIQSRSTPVSGTDVVEVTQADLVSRVARLERALEPLAALGKRKAQYCIQPDDPIILEAIRALAR